MDMNNAFPSKYLSSSDFANGPASLQIAGVRMEDVSPDNKPPEHKPVMYFTGVERGIVLNVTNNKVLCALFGGESDHWAGQAVEIYVIDTEFQGEPKKGIRLRGVQPAPIPMGAAQTVSTVQSAFPGAQPIAAPPVTAPPPNFVPNTGIMAPAAPGHPQEQVIDDGIPDTF